MPQPRRPAAPDSRGAVCDRDLLGLLEQMGDVDSGVRRRVTLLVYAHIPAAHDFLVSVFGHVELIIDRGPRDSEHGRSVTITDPFGHRWLLAAT